MKDITIIEAASSILRSVDKALVTVCQVELEDIPYIEKVSQDNVWVAMEEKGMFVSTVFFSREVNKQPLSGIGILYVSREDAIKLFSELKITENSSNEEIKKLCGEVCKTAIEGMKSDMEGLGHTGMEIQPVTNYVDEVNEKISVTGGCNHFGMIFRKNYEKIFSFDLILQTL